MNDLKDFDISFIGLKDGEHHFEYRIDKKFFDFFNYEDFYGSDVVVNLMFLKKPTMFELNFDISGWVEVACDTTSERFEQPISSDFKLVVKFGSTYNDENEELLIIPYAEYKLNVAQYIYEAIVLAVPIKRIHPGLIDGTLHSEILEKLKEFEISEQRENFGRDPEKEIDPRWEKLKNIQIEKNKRNGTS